MNRWKFPADLERTVVERDRLCVYCGISFEALAASRRGRPSWEHIVNDARLVTPENIARCCVACNASEGAGHLATWLESEYCRSSGVTDRNVADVVRSALARARE